MMSNTTPITEESILAFNHGWWNPVYFIKHMLCYLREHMHLLKDPDYQLLYDELLDYLFRDAAQRYGWTENERRRTEYLELLADLQNKYGDRDFERFPSVLVEDYLEHRRHIWNKRQANH